MLPFYIRGNCSGGGGEAQFPLPFSLFRKKLCQYLMKTHFYLLLFFGNSPLKLLVQPLPMSLSGYNMQAKYVPEPIIYAQFPCFPVYSPTRTGSSQTLMVFSLLSFKPCLQKVLQNSFLFIHALCLDTVISVTIKYNMLIRLDS